METTSQKTAQAPQVISPAKPEKKLPADFVALHLETRTHVSTAVMCRHLGRQPQTARGWACHETYPPGLRPIRVMGRLAWPVAAIAMLLGQVTAGGAKK